ncbi:MAG: phosphoglycerate mutase family protein [Bacteroidota bacterium]
MKNLLRYAALLLLSMAFAKCSTQLIKLEDQSLRHLESNTIVTSKRSMPLPFYENSEATVIYLVRHAEKKKDGKDPELTSVGQQRATRLLKILQNTAIDAVYSTKYLRTIQTAEPLAQLKQVPVLDYNPRELATFAERLKQMKGKRVLVSGHSNTTPSLVNLLIGNEVYKQIDESDYDNFYVVSLMDGQPSQHVKLRY